MNNKGSGGFGVMVKRGLVSALGVLAGSYLLEGIDFDDNGTLVLVVVLLGLFSAVLKPVLVLFALPFVVATLGIGILFINALLYLLVGNLVEGFYVESFGTAFFGALIMTFFNLFFSNWIGEKRSGRFNVKTAAGSRARGPAKGARASASRPKAVKAKDDVIDI